MENKHKIFKFIFLVSAIIPATILLFFSFMLIIKVLSDIGYSFKFKELSLLSSGILGILGYVGLILALIGKKKRITFILLLCGILSFVLFNSTEGGFSAWKWVLTMEEPDEWFVFVWPTIVSIVYAAILGRKLTLT